MIVFIESDMMVSSALCSSLSLCKLLCMVPFYHLCYMLQLSADREARSISQGGARRAQGFGRIYEYVSKIKRKIGFNVYTIELVVEEQKS